MRTFGNTAKECFFRLIRLGLHTEAYVEKVYYREYAVSVEYNQREVWQMRTFGNTAKECFFRLIRLGLHIEGCISLPVMNDGLWAEIFFMAQKQALTGVMMEALNRLPEEVNRPNEEQRIKLMKVALKAEKINMAADMEAVRWTEFFGNRGYKSMLLKGQGLAMLYPNPRMRMPGDTDLWVMGDSGCIRKLCRDELGAREFTYHHIGVKGKNGMELEVHTTPSWMYSFPKNRRLQRLFGRDELGAREFTYHHIGVKGKNGMELEVHTTPSWMYSFPKNRRLQRLFGLWSGTGREIVLSGAGRVCVPSDEMNRVFLLVHMYRHVFSEGIGLRQMADYAMLLRKGCTEEEKAVFGRQAKELNLYGFAGAVMYVMERVFGLDRNCLLTEPDSKKGEKLLDEVMAGGNFGKYDGKIDRTIKSDSAMSFLTRNARNFRLLKEYPEEVLWGPVFKVWHRVWRKMVK